MRYAFIGLILIGIALVAVVAYVFFASKRIPPTDYTWATVRIRDAEFRVRIADTMPKQIRGLSGYPKLDVDEGMLFVFATSSPRAFWMKEMNFPIDIIWIRDQKVIGFAERAAPEPGVSAIRLKLYPSPGFASKVFEVPAGTVEKLGIMAGDEVMVQYP